MSDRRQRAHESVPSTACHKYGDMVTFTAEHAERAEIILEIHWRGAGGPS